jgi:hypothetical protein
MATLIELCGTGELYKLDPQLEANEQEWRMIYLSPDLRLWLEKDLPNLEATWSTEIDPTQQLDALVEEYCSGCTLYYGPQFHPIRHVQDGIWELKTPDLRIFGFFHVRDCFIGWRAGHTDFIKKHDLYYGFAGETAGFRARLNLNDPKFVPGDDPNAVVSNFS